jgi:hypothetical protein
VANCLDDCADRGFQFAFVTNIAADLTCSCATNVNIVVPSLCGLGANFIYTNNLIAPSGIPARRRALEVKRNQKVGMCPSGLQACRVSGEFTSDDFEVSFDVLFPTRKLLTPSVSMSRPSSSRAVDALPVSLTVTLLLLHLVSSEFFLPR